MSLFKHLALAFRGMMRRKSYALLNVLGLALGLTVGFLVLIYITYETSFESHVKNGDRVARIIQIKPMGGDIQIAHMPYLAGKAGPEFEQAFPEIEAMSRLFGLPSRMIERGDRKEMLEGVIGVDSAFVDMFSIKLTAGDPHTCLSSPGKIVLFPKVVEMMFGDEDPMGKTLTLDGDTYVVAGVAENIPANSHLEFDVLVHSSVILDNPGWSFLLDWYTGSITYVQLAEGVDWDDLAERVTNYYHTIQADSDDATLVFQPLKDIHLKSGHYYFDYAMNRGNQSSLYLFGVVALGVILLAAINYMNLSTAQFIQRGREVAMKKVVGATRSQLVRQFMTESLLAALVALPVTFILVEILLPVFGNLAGRELPNLLISDPRLLLLAVGLTVLLGFLSGLYPAFILSTSRPMSMLSSRTTESPRGVLIRRVLVVVQFAMSIILLATAWMVSAQLDYLQAQPLGFHSDHLVILRLGDESEARDWTALRDDMLALSGVQGAATSQVVPGWWTAQDHVKPEGYTGEEAITVNLNIVCDQYVKAYGLEIIEGRDFDATRPADLASVIMNESAMRTFGWETATDKTMTSVSGRTYPITGVIRDYHFMSLHSAVEPQILVYYPSRAEFLSLRIDAKNVPTTLDDIREVWKRHRPDRPIEIHFHEEGLADWYTAEENLQSVMKAFTLLAALISCLGLIGLTAHTLERRRREIGIRKVLGAQAGRLFGMLTREFVVLMVIANVIGWPIAFYALRGWMQEFVVRMPIPIWIVPVLALTTLGIVIAVIGGQTLRAVAINPAEIIREE